MAYRLNPNSLDFPPVRFADADGLLAIGGDLSEERLLNAYTSGIFPWFSEYSPILWWSPDPRFVILPHQFTYPKSLRPLLRKQHFRVTFNQAFERVIQNCKVMPRPNQHGTWITPELMRAYVGLHHKGFAHSVEVWNGDNLVGGLFGEILGKCFFGESMYAIEDNASKIGFVVFAQNLFKNGIRFIDCQVYTKHLERFGAQHMPREEFIGRLNQGKVEPFDVEKFSQHFSDKPEFVLEK